MGRGRLEIDNDPDRGVHQNVGRVAVEGRAAAPVNVVPMLALTACINRKALALHQPGRDAALVYLLKDIAQRLRLAEVSAAPVREDRMIRRRRQNQRYARFSFTFSNRRSSERTPRQ